MMIRDISVCMPESCYSISAQLVKFKMDRCALWVKRKIGIYHPGGFHALDLLEQFHEMLDELGVTELSKRLKLHKNNVFRLLATSSPGGT